MRKLPLTLILAASVYGCSRCDNPELPRDAALDRAQDYLRQMAEHYDLRDARLWKDDLDALKALDIRVPRR
jgi:hypothetical protein